MRYFSPKCGSNILAAIREGDYSIRGRRALSGDALGEVMLEVNDLGQTLREQRLGHGGGGLIRHQRTLAARPEP